MRNPKIASMVVLATATSLLLAACGSPTSAGSAAATTGARNGTLAGAVRGGTLNMLGSGDVDYLDPNLAYYSPTYQTLRLWSRQLFTNPADPAAVTTSVPDLAEQIPTAANGGISADGKTYTITIKQAAQWNTSPPRQVTAADEVIGVKRTCNPAEPFGGLPDVENLIVGFQQFCDGFAKVGQDVASIKNYIMSTPLPGVTAKDDRTVVFTLTHPATYLVDLLTLPALSPAPVEVLSFVPGSTDLAQHQVSDGPYAIDAYNPTKKIVFSRNPAWNPGTDTVRGAFVDQIVIDETVSQESTQQQLQAGTAGADMEFDNRVPASQIPSLQVANDPNLNLGETGASSPYIVFNFKSPNNNGALANIKVRQALEYAINRDNIIQVLGGPKVDPPLTHVLPPGILGSRDTPDGYPYNPAKAKQMLTDAGFPNGITLKVLYRSAQDESSKTFQTVQHDLGAAGITVTGMPAPNADFFTKYLEVPDVGTRGVFDVAIPGWFPDWYGNAALSYFKPLFGGQAAFPPDGSNFGYYDNPALQNLIDEAVNATDPVTTADAWARADAQVMADAAFFPITSPRWPNYHARQVHNAVYLPSIENFDPANVWLDADAQGG